MEKKKHIIKDFENYFRNLNIQKYDEDFVAEVLIICKEQPKIKQEIIDFLIKENIISLDSYKNEYDAIKIQQRIEEQYYNIAEKYNIYEKEENDDFTPLNM